MTSFWRNGFWRTSVHGVEHWVDGHSVDRNDWERSGTGTTDSLYYHALVRDARAGRSFSATYVNPNADCPVCGAPVFFYQNASGSRVFFDELGPPWPKHPCTDTSEVGNTTSHHVEAVEPQKRREQEVRFLEHWMPLSGYDPERAFVVSHQLAPWVPLWVEARFKRRSLVVARRFGSSKPSRMFLQVRDLPQHIAVGTPIHYFRGWISLFDVDAGEALDLPVTRLSGSTEFLDQLLENGRASRPGV